MKLVPLLALLLFVALDVLANWRVIQSLTVSEIVWGLPWPVRGALGLVLLGVTSHIVFLWPFGP